MIRHTRSRIGRLGVVACALIATVGVSAIAPTTAGATVRTANVLGTKNPAKGTPVKIGFITDDKTSGTDNSIETPVANAATQWINEYGNGVGGHPIELDRCVSGGTATASVDCANQMITDKVAAVVVGSNQFFLNLWTPLHAAGIPVFVFASGNPDALADPSSTFVFSPGSTASTALNVAAAKAAKAKKVSAVVIDVPAATQFFKTDAPAQYQKAGLGIELTTVPLGTADMTAQMAKVVADNPKGVVYVLGNDTFCIAAFNGLRTAGFTGPVTTGLSCLSDATRTAVPADFLKGMQITATAPVDTPKDPSIKQYYAVLDKYGAASVDKTRVTGISMFQALAGLNVATQNLKGDATPASIIAAGKAMPWTVLPVAGGLHVRCNGKANPAQPAVCTTATLAATLDSTGKATKYTKVGDTQIPG